MRKVRQILIIAFFVFSFSATEHAQQIPPSYGFLEVVNFKNEPVPDASVSLLNSGYSEKTDQNGRIEKGLRIDPGSYETPFSIEKTGFFTFIDYYELFDFLRSGWRSNRENPIKIELLKIPGNRAERKIIGKEQQKREFFGAARSGDALAVKKFIKSGLSPNLTTSDLRGIPAKKDVPIIMFAAKSGNGETVREFLSAGVKVSNKEEPLRDILVVYLQSLYGSYYFKKTYPNTDAERRELQNAFEKGAEILIDAGAEINSGALPIAIRNGYLQTVKKLVAKGANINAENYNGETALHIAISYEKKEIIGFLLENGANPNVLIGKENSSYYYCNSPLMMAVERGDINLIKLLLGKKANSNLTCQNGKNALRIALQNRKDELFRILIEAGADVKAVDENGENNLMFAVHQEDTATVKKMIAAGIPVNERNKQGSTALMIAVQNGSMYSRFEKAKLLIEAGADATAVNDKKMTNSYGDFYTCETPLINIAGNADLDLVQNTPISIIDLLIANKADVNYTCRNGQTALLGAIWGSQAKGVKKLLEAGADVSGEKGKIALETARKVWKSDYNKDRIEEIIRMLEAVVEK